MKIFTNLHFTQYGSKMHFILLKLYGYEKMYEQVCINVQSNVNMKFNRFLVSIRSSNCIL